MRQRLADDEEILAAIAELVDDGFCPRRDLVAHFPRLSERDLRGSLARAVRRGLLLERRGRDGGLYFAITGEGWAALEPGSGR